MFSVQSPTAPFFGDIHRPLSNYSFSFLRIRHHEFCFSQSRFDLFWQRLCLIPKSLDGLLVGAECGNEHGFFYFSFSLVPGDLCKISE